ncbi:MAG: hypothetical protein PHW19_10440 [Salinivirgaceae bacterium]|nr:hypothetical protein [Salinivirgaceae bacterium]
MKNTFHSNNTDAIHSDCANAMKTQFIPITPMPYISPVETQCFASPFTQCFASPFTQRCALPLYNIARRHYAPLHISDIHSIFAIYFDCWTIHFDGSTILDWIPQHVVS